ncbi:MAG: co-chaperone GroES [Gemmatimonadetes bacterium]|nr:co-chaperone GroES [Gemmatimonadota bacterium]
MANKAAVNVKPLADRVVVSPLEEEEQMRGGLYIPDTAKEKPQSGKIIAVGEGKLSDEGVRIAPDVEVGQTVLYGKYSGTEVTVEGEEYLIMREDDILAAQSQISRVLRRRHGLTDYVEDIAHVLERVFTPAVGSRTRRLL